MLNVLFSSPLAFVIIFGGLLVAITIHEFAHAYVADLLGDPTPRANGRVTLDPRAHLDPLGTVAILLTRFGWGKPVQFDPYNLKEPVRDTALIALAGPISNISLSMVLSLILYTMPIGAGIGSALVILIYINLMLAIFNLIPVHPLDGSKIILVLLPKETAFEYEQVMNKYGILILLFLIFPWGGGSSPVSQLVLPVINFLSAILIP